MAFKVFSVCLVIAFSGMCLCQSEAPPYPAISPSQASVQPRSAAVQQIKLEDIERDSLIAAAAYGQKTQQQSGKPVAAAPGQPQPQQQSYQAVAPQQQYYVQSYQAQPQQQQQQQQQQQFYVQPYNAQPQQYLAQPYQSAFDYPGVQYMFINPSAYNPVNPIYQQYYVPAAQPSTVPQYVTKQSTPVQAQQEYKQQQAAATPVQVQQQYKQQFTAAPSGQAQQEYRTQFAAATAAPVQAQQQYKQQFAAAPSGQAQQEYRTQFAVQAQPEYKQQLPAQQQYVVPSSPAYQYVQQPAAAASPVDISYITNHPTATGVQFKPQPQQVQYNTVPQQFQQQQYYYTVPAAAAAAAAAEQPRAVQQSAKSQYSSGVKSTTPTPYKESFAYKFESSPPAPQQQPAAAAYSTLRYSA